MVPCSSGFHFVLFFLSFPIYRTCSMLSSSSFSILCASSLASSLFACSANIWPLPSRFSSLMLMYSERLSSFSSMVANLLLVFFSFYSRSWILSSCVSDSILKVFLSNLNSQICLFSALSIPPMMVLRLMLSVINSSLQSWGPPFQNSLGPSAEF